MNCNDSTKLLKNQNFGLLTRRRRRNRIDFTAFQVRSSSADNKSTLHLTRVLLGSAIKIEHLSLPPMEYSIYPITLQTVT